jgi:hypothetical protein
VLSSWQLAKPGARGGQVGGQSRARGGGLVKGKVGGWGGALRGIDVLKASHERAMEGFGTGPSENGVESSRRRMAPPVLQGDPLTHRLHIVSCLPGGPLVGASHVLPPACSRPHLPSSTKPFTLPPPLSSVPCSTEQPSAGRPFGACLLHNP